MCVREGHGVLPGEQTGHTGSTTRQVHPHLPHPGPQEISVLPLQDVHEQGTHRYVPNIQCIPPFRCQ